MNSKSQIPKYTLAMIFGVAILTPLWCMGADWSELNPGTSPTARYGHSLTTVGTDVYLFGGRNTPGVEYNDLWVWNRGLETWDELNPSPPLPSVRFLHGAASVEGRLYIGFGLGPGGPLGDIWEYDPDTNSWQEIVIPGPGVRQHGGLAALGTDKLFVAGGYNDTNGTSTIVDAWILDPVAETGIQIASLPEARIGFAAAADGDAPLIIGGFLPGSSTITNDVLVWNPVPAPSGTWDTVVPTGSTPLARSSAATVQILAEPPEKASNWGDDILILGGDGGSKAVTTTTSTSTQMYNVNGNEWAYGEDMPVGLASAAAAVLPPLQGAPTIRLEVLMFGGLEMVGMTPTPSDNTYLYLSEIEVPQIRIFSDDFESNNTDAWSAAMP